MIFVNPGVRAAAFGLLVGCGFWAVAPRSAAAAVDLTKIDTVVGRWEMSLDDTERRCEVTFRSDFAAPGYAVDMPAGCRRAMPILADVTAWKAAAPSRLDLEDASGATVIEFHPAADAGLIAKGPEGETYELVTVAAAGDGAGAYPVVARAATPSPAASAGPHQAVAVDAQTTADVAGRYDLLRDGNKDTGCLLTLEATARGPKGSFKAILAPACGDQGVVIFDPVGWEVSKTRITLTGRKGYIYHFDLQPDATWGKDPKEGAPLFLKRI